MGSGENGKAIEDSFGMSLESLEKELKTYVRRGDFAAQRDRQRQPANLRFVHGHAARSLSEGEANYYLGDLLLHIGREKDAERYFKQAIALDPGFIPPYASLGSDLRISAPLRGSEEVLAEGDRLRRRTI